MDQVYPKRVLIKLSGESLSQPDNSFGIEDSSLSFIVKEIQALKEKGIEIVLVIGGGNIVRGSSMQNDIHIKRISADQMGMLATLINGMALADAFKAAGIPFKLTSTLSCPQIADLYNPQKAINHIEEGFVVICTTGAGTTHVTTDTAAALRACELKVDVILKATMNVNGIYDKDPLLYPDAKLYEQISFKEYITKQLSILDVSAVSLCMNANIPIRVFNFNKFSLLRAVIDEKVCSIIKNLDE